jgi:hypothetical protein
MEINLRSTGLRLVEPTARREYWSDGEMGKNISGDIRAAGPTQIYADTFLATDSHRLTQTFQLAADIRRYSQMIAKCICI